MKKREFKDDLTNTWFWLGIAFGVCLVAFFAALYMFGDVIAFGGIECSFHKFTHLYCPGCGGTRASYYLSRGRFLKSFLCNPFVIYTVGDYIVFMINTILVKLTKKVGFTGFPVTVTIYVGVGILLGQCVVRNILLIGWGITCL